ncbi:unnamed protein product [Closterium sp. NIES-54]
MTVIVDMVGIFTLHPPLVSTRAALLRHTTRSRAAPPSRAALPCRAVPPTKPRRSTEPRLPTKPRRPTEPHCPACPTASAATAATATTVAMASPTVLTFDAKGRAVDFDVWVDNLQLFLQCDSRDGVSLFDHTSSVSTAPAATADSTIRPQWTTRDVVARLAIRSHLPPAERAHFGQYKTAQSLYDAVVARYSSPATAALSHLMLPCLFPDLAAFATVANHIAHLRTSDARYRAALPTEFSVKNPPPPPCASHGDRRTPFFEGCSPVPLLPYVASAAAVDLVGTEEVGTASAPSGRCPNSKTKGSKGGGGDGGGGVSGTLGVGGLGVQVPALTFFAPALVVGRCFPDAVELSRWHDLLLQNVPILDLDFDNLLAAMYAFADSAEGDCYLSVPPDPGTVAVALGASAAAALGASASAAQGAGMSPLFGIAPTESFHTFTLNSGGSRSFFRDSTTLTLLSRPAAVSLADPSGGPILAHSSTVLPCPVAPSGLLSGLHLPSFSTNLVSGADLQDAWSSQVFAAESRSSPASPPCSCPPLSHEALLCHHRLGHPSLPRLRGMASRALVSGLPRSLPPLPPGPAPTYVPCVEGRQRATPHSSSFPPTEAPLQTLHMDVWGPARVHGQGLVCYFLLVVDDYSRYTTVFPLRSKGEVPEVLIDWIHGARRQLSESFGSDLPDLRLHSDRGGEFSSDLLRAFCRSKGIRQTFTLPASPQQNGIAERRISMVMDVARTSMIHATAPHFLWPFAVQYAAHHINLAGDHTYSAGDGEGWRCVRVPCLGISTADKLSSGAVPCVFLGFPPDPPGWQFYHPTLRHVLSSQDITFDESGPAPSGVSQVDPDKPVEVAVDSGAARGAEPEGAGTEGAETRGAESRGAESRRAEPGGVEPEETVSGGADLARAERGGALGVSSRREPLSPQRLREWYSRVLLHVAAQRDYKLHSLDFSTAFLQGSLHEEIWLRRPPGFIGSFPAGTQWSLRRPVYGLRQAPREWHDTLRTTLASLGFAPSTADPSCFLCSDATLPPFYVLFYIDDLVFATADTEALAHMKSELQKRHTCTDLGELTSYLGLRITRDRAQRTITLTQSHMVQQVLQRFGFTYSSPQSTPLPTGHSLSAPPSDESVEPSGPYPELVGCLMLELSSLVTLTPPGLTTWLRSGRNRVTPSVLAPVLSLGGLPALLLTDLGEAPRSPPVLYVDNKAMLALCQEHRLEHRTKHIALRYFLARELQQHGQLRLAYMASQANTADVFTKALQPCDHQRFCTVLGLVPTMPHLLSS